MGSRDNWNQKINDSLRQTYKDAGVVKCEECGSDFALSWHHRQKRRHYKSWNEMTLWNQTVLLCCVHHGYCENGKGKGKDRITAEQYSDYLFTKLRGDDQLE